MKKILPILLFIFSVFYSLNSNAQVLEDTTALQDSTLYRIVTSDDVEKLGYIIKQDEREILFLTNDNRRIIIPQYVVKKIEVVKKEDFNIAGQFVGEDRFATRYFITTNGLPIKKGENYIQWNLFGPDIQFAVGDNFGLGLMTSWFATPIVATAKYSLQLGPKSQMAIGALLGTSSWATFTSDFNFGGALPFASLSFGSRKSNIAFSGGYGAVWLDGDVSGRALTSVAGMVKLSPKFSLVFDSFIVLKGAPTTTQQYVYNSTTGVYSLQNVTERSPGGGIFIPGVRFHQAEGKAIQFGFAALAADGEFLPVGVPMIQWYRSF
jgi:hypothetical protein